jgi:hypothetical protein
VGQSVLVSGTHMGPSTNYSFSSKFSLDSWEFVDVERPLWLEDRSVIYCCCWYSPAQSRSCLSLAGFKTIFYCPNSWDSPNLEGQVPIFISPRNMVAQLPTGTGFPCCRLLWLAGLRWRYSNPAPHRLRKNNRVLSFYTTRAHKKQCIQQTFYCWVSIRCRSNVFTELLSDNDRRDKDTQTDWRNLWSKPLRWPQVSWYTYKVSYRLVLAFRS